MLFATSASLAAGGTAYPLSNWSLRQPPVAGVLEIFADGSAAGLTMSLTTGTENIVQQFSTVSGGGTAGVLPNRFTVEPAIDRVGAGDEIVLAITNPTGGAITYNVVAIWTPASGS